MQLTKIKGFYSAWNKLNITAGAFLFLLILSLILLSAFQPANQNGSPDTNPEGHQPVGVIGNDKEETPSLDELNEKEQKLRELEYHLLGKEQKLNEQEEQLNEQEASLRDLVEVRTKIVRELIDKFSQSNLVLEIDNLTGAIRFSDGILFDHSMDSIKTDGANYLKEFIPDYFSILLSEENRIYIAEIIIEGHTDDIGSYIYNLDLSQRRAFAVARYILSQDIPNLEYRDIIHTYLTANGRSYSQPIMTGGLIDQERSRRVEFKFRLKDEETIKEIQQIFERTSS